MFHAAVENQPWGRDAGPIVLGLFPHYGPGGRAFYEQIVDYGQTHHGRPAVRFIWATRHIRHDLVNHGHTTERARFLARTPVPLTARTRAMNRTVEPSSPVSRSRRRLPPAAQARTRRRGLSTAN